MSVRIIRKLLIVLVIASLFSGCGELDVVLPSTGTYQVKALVNSTSLDDCSLVNASNAIRPYFASSVTNDPDITGLMVSLQNARGEVLGGKILYTLKPEANPGYELVLDPSASRKKAETAPEPVEGEAPEVEEEIPVARIGSVNTLIPAKRLDKNLPDFFMPENLQIGQYTLVFQVLGEKETLYQTEEAIYYLGNAKFNLKEIQMYLPGASLGPRLVSPGMTIMLEARLDFDPRLDPYIIWYNGKKLISEGKLSEGAASFLWEAPEQTGFHSLRAEAFPFSARQGIAGSSREIAIPVSSKALSADIVAGSVRELVHWYQFGGDVQDSTPPISAEKALLFPEENPPRWSPMGYTYGLSAGPDAAYLLPRVSFSGGKTEGGGQFLLRLKPLAEGAIFSAVFASAAPSGEALEMNLALKGETLTLNLGAPGKAAEALSAPVVSVSGDYITIAIDFSIQPNRFEAALNPAYFTEAGAEERSLLADDVAEIRAGGIGLAAPLNGECGVKLGVSGSSEKEAAGVTAIWDEFAVLR